MTKIDRNNIINIFKDKTKSVDDSSDKAIINKKSKTSFSVKSDGTTSLSAGMYAQLKIEEELGLISSMSFQDTTNTVQKHLNARDINVNSHKFNNQFIDLTDFKTLSNGTVIGNMTVDTTVLVKA